MLVLIAVLQAANNVLSTVQNHLSSITFDLSVLMKWHKAPIIAKMKSLKYILIALSCCFTAICTNSSDLNAQFFGPDVYEAERSKQLLEDTGFNRYEFEEFLRQMQADRLLTDGDSISGLRRQVLASPEELRKLGVSEELIEEMLRLNAVQDSLYFIGSGLEGLYGEEGSEVADSISLYDVQEIVEWQKRQLYAKAFELPEAYVFGHEFFRKNLVNISDGGSQGFRASDNYVLGKGDEIAVVIWGNNEFNQSYQIDEKGSINPGSIGKIYLQGIEFGKAKEIISGRFLDVYGSNNNQIEITMIYSRRVNVNVVGEVFNPGSYSFNGINSAFNTLVAVEGPNQIGSVRNISVRRGGEDVKTLDVYQYLLNPDSEQDFFLMDNDYLLVPPLGNVVNIAGEVQRPHNYEMKDGETLQDLIGYAGKLTPAAYSKNINVKRYADNKEVLIDVNLDSLRNTGRKFQVLAGDSVYIYRIPSTLSNYVDLQGAVQVPGKYELKKGDRVSDVMYRAQGPLEIADLEKAFVIRLNEKLTKEVIPFDLQKALLDHSSMENIQLQSRDTIRVVSKDQYRERYQIYVAGEVNDPGDYEYAKGITLWDMVRMAGGIKREAANSRLEVSRLVVGKDNETFNPNKERVVMKRVNIGSNLQIPEYEKNFELQPYDQLFIRLSPDFEIPQQVTIVGEITYPGEYSLLRKDERIESLVERAGGFSNYAYQSAARLYRHQDSLGVVILDLKEALENPDRSEFNYLLTDGDSIVVPKLKDFVTLRGAIRHFEVDSIAQVNVPYDGKRSAKYYVKNYGGGFGKSSSRFRTYVQQPNGQVEKTKRILFFNKYPAVEEGATVFVDITEWKRREPIRIEQRKTRDWNDAFNSTAAKISAVLSVLVLVTRL